MSEWNCEVIRDLLPSYLDEICSPSSRRLVDEHVRTCSACRDLVEQMRGTEIVSQQAEQKEIDYMRKVRSRFENRSRSLFLLFALVLAAGLAVLLWNYGDVPKELIYVIQPLLGAGACIAFFWEEQRQGPAGWKWLVGAASLAVTCGCVGVMLYSIQMIAAGRLPFDLQLQSLGPFVYRINWIGAAVQTVLFLFAAWRGMRSRDACPVLLQMTVLGGCVGLVQNSLLRNMSTVEEIYREWGTALAVPLAECVVMMIVLGTVSRWRRGKER